MSVVERWSGSASGKKVKASDVKGLRGSPVQVTSM